MPCFPKASKPLGCGSPINDGPRQRPWVVARLADYCFWLFVLIGTATFHRRMRKNREVLDRRLLPSRQRLCRVSLRNI